jgi:hypothetical protein
MNRTARSMHSTIRSAAVAACLGIGCAGVLALPAAAWPQSSAVTVRGSTGCGPGIQTATVYANLDSEGYRVGTASGAPPSYSVTFQKVSSSGGWGWFWVDCAVAGDHGTWARVYRPAVGSYITVNL